MAHESLVPSHIIKINIMKGREIKQIYADVRKDERAE